MLRQAVLRQAVLRQAVLRQAVLRQAVRRQVRRPLQARQEMVAGQVEIPVEAVSILLC
uniref:pentapeptide repeat-containing protein n=1 Tax=Teredinibacter franksiae TaxID=2761453 RepID=UPI0035E459E9